MTFEEAGQILGPELTARVDAHAAQHPPLTSKQVAHLALLVLDRDEQPSRAA